MEESIKKESGSLESMEEVEINNLRNNLEKLKDLWREYGITEEEKIQRGKLVWIHIASLVEDIFNEEKCLCEEVKRSIQDYKKQVIELSEMLAVIPKLYNDTSLIKQEENLIRELNSLTQLKHLRIKSLLNLRTVESKLCSSLRIQEYKLSASHGVPSAEDLQNIEHHIILLRDEHERRFKKFCVYKMELTTILEVTEICPETQLEKDVLSGNEVIPLTNETLNAVEEAVNKAHKKKIEIKNQIESLLRKLSTWWDLLQVPYSKRAECLSNHQDCKISTLTALRHELEKLEKDIKIYIDNRREKLEKLWDNCFVSESERGHFYIDCSKDVTDAHQAFELEIEKWEKYYEGMKSIATKIEKRRELWDLLLNLENKATDPKRLMNRKGNLLKEEKELSKLLKDLRILEKELFCEIETYDSTYKKPFLYFGQDYKSCVADQWQGRMNRKGNGKTERQKRLVHTEHIKTSTSAKKQLLTNKNQFPVKPIKNRHNELVHSTPIHKSSRNPCSSGKPVFAIKLKNSAQKFNSNL